MVSPSPKQQQQRQTGMMKQNKSSPSVNKNKKKSLLAAHLERSSASKSTPTHNDDSCRMSVHSETTATTVATDSVSLTSPSRDSTVSHASTISTLSTTNESTTDLVKKDLLPSFEDSGATDVFDRLYHNQKRSQKLWKDPTKQHPQSPRTPTRVVARATSPRRNPSSSSSLHSPLSPPKSVRTVSSLTTSSPPVSPCFDRLYHNEKRTESLWKDPRKSPHKNKSTVQPTIPWLEPLPSSKSKKTTTKTNTKHDPFGLLSSLRPRPPHSDTKHNQTSQAWKELQVQHQDLLSSSLLLGGDDDDDDEQEEANKRGREREPRSKRANRNARSMSPKRTIAPTTTSAKANKKSNERSCHNKHKSTTTTRAHRSLSPKRTTSSPTAKVPVLPNISATFERLYRNEKRTEHVWKEPARHHYDHRYLSKSPTNTKSATTVKAVPAIFDRLYHNEKRKEHLWHVPPKPRSTSLPRKATTQSVDNINKSFSSVGSAMEDSCSSLSSSAAKKRLQIPSRKSRRVSRSTSLKQTINSTSLAHTSTYCSPTVSNKDTAPVPLVSLSPSRRACQACVQRERSRSLKSSSSTSKHEYLRSRSRSSHRSAKNDSSAVSILSLPTTTVTPDTSCAMKESSSMHDTLESQEGAMLLPSKPTTTTKQSSTPIVLTPETLASTTMGGSEERRSSCARSHSSSPPRATNDKDTIKTNKRRSRRMPRSLSPMVRSKGNDAMTPLSRLQKEIMELQELANRLNQKEQVITTPSNISSTAGRDFSITTTSPKNGTNQPNNDECHDLLSSNGISKQLFKEESGLECIDDKAMISSTTPTTAWASSASEREGDSKGDVTSSCVTTVSPTASEHQGLSSLTPPRETQPAASMSSRALVENFSSPPKVEVSNGRNSPADIVAMEETPVPNAKPAPSAVASLVGTSSNVSASKQTGKSPMKTKRAAGPKMGATSTTGTMSQIVRPQMGNQVAADILDHYIEENIPAVKKSIALHDAAEAEPINDEETIDQAAPTRLSYSIYNWWNPSIARTSLQSNQNQRNQHRNDTEASGTSIPPQPSLSSSQAPVSSPNVAPSSSSSSTVNRPFLFPKPPITACFGWLFLQPRHHDF